MKKLVSNQKFVSNQKIILSCIFMHALSSLHATYYTTALTSGYVFKQGDNSKKVYGHGIVDVLTFDNCYYPLKHLGVGAKLSYWRGTGHTDFLRMPTLLQQVPVTFYLRGMKEFDCHVRLYGSFGGGVTWVQEKSYLGNTSSAKGLGEIEVGLGWSFWRFLSLTAAVRYLFPPQSVHHSQHKVDVGGCDLRAGIECAF